jgi:DNA-binding NtrC family response regulator
MPALDPIRRAPGAGRRPWEVKASAERGARQQTLMIVDDNPRIIDALSAVLRDKYAIVGCASAAEVERRYSDEIKAVLLDIKMAPDDGTVIFAQLRKKSPQLPIIFHTAYPGNSEAVDRIRELDPDGFLLKGDYTLGQLEELLDQVLSRRPAARGV